MPRLIALKDEEGIGRGISSLFGRGGVGTNLPVCFDIETTGLDPRKHKLISIAFKPEGRLPLIIDARDYPIDLLCLQLQPIFANKNILLRGHNLAFDLLWMRSYIGIPEIRCKLYDTQLAELTILGKGWVEAKKQGTGVSLGALGERYGIEVHKEERNWFIDLDKRDGWFQPFPNEQLEYMRQDVSVPHRVYKEQQKAIKEQGLGGVIDLENRTIPATVEMMHRGVYVDLPAWHIALDKIKLEAERLAEEVHEFIDIPVMTDRLAKYNEKVEPYRQWIEGRDAFIALGKYDWENGKNIEAKWGEEKRRLQALYLEDHPRPTPPPPLKAGVNLDSPLQIYVGFRGLGLDIPNAKEETLQQYANDPRVNAYLEYKKYSTNIIKYGDKYLDEHIQDGKMYPQYGQYNAGTGRYASYDPNIQQIPSKGVGAALKKAIIARPGHVYISADYNTVELRILAALSKDPVMLLAFNNGEDLHALTAVRMFGLEDNQEYMRSIANGMSSKDWTKSHDAIVNGHTLKGIPYRHVSKTINFLLANGGGAVRLASELLIKLPMAKTLMALHKSTFSVAFNWLNKQGELLDKARARGEERVYNSSVSGRRRWLTIPKLNIPQEVTAEEVYAAQDKWKGQLANIRRQLMNVTMQGSSADITKTALSLWMERYNCDSMYVTTCVHDEIVLTGLNNENVIEEAKVKLIECMSEAFNAYITNLGPGPIEPVVSYRWEH